MDWGANRILPSKGDTEDMVNNIVSQKWKQDRYKTMR